MKNTTLLGLHALTSIAAGTGQNLGAIDLPIMREATTNYPVVFGSALKGALRAKFEEEQGKDAVKYLFGDDDKGGSKYAGALIISDARTLLLPVRSMTTHFKWVTCPYILDRLKSDMAMLGQKVSWQTPKIQIGTALTASKSESTLYLEEFAVTTQEANLKELVETISHLMGGEKSQELSAQLVVVDNDMFAHLSRFATPVNAHIAIDNATKIVKNGALWYEETLPPETLLYAMLIANSPRSDGDREIGGQQVKEYVMQHLAKENYLQVGGNETVGMGWCKVVCHG